MPRAGESVTVNGLVPCGGRGVILSRFETAEHQWRVSRSPSIGAFPLQRHHTASRQKICFLGFTSRAMEIGANVPKFSHLKGEAPVF